MNFFKISKKELKMSTNNESLDGSFSTSHKILIRQNWNLPLLKFFTKKYEDKLVYMGLPSSKAEDVLAWIDYIKTVIAFQCRVYGEMSSQDQDRIEIEKLEEILRSLERQRKLENFVVYDGYLEEVVLRKKDNSPYRIDFKQESLITLYNLDFCNKISSPMEYVDLDGNIKTVYKFNAIKELLQIQDSLSKVSDKFIFFLTVHCSYDGKELHDFIQNPPEGLNVYIEKYKQLKSHEKNARIVRLFVVHLIEKFFSTYNFTPKILPIIKYNGINDTPLLHFVIMGSKSENTASGTAQKFQTLEEVVNHKFISFDSNEDLISLNSELDELDVPILNSREFFVQSKTYKKLW